MPEASLPQIFSPQLQALRRARARAIGPANFLHEFAAHEVNERLTEVARSFETPLCVAAQPELWGDLLEIRPKTVAVQPHLPLNEGAHDLVIHAMALHGDNDPVGQIIQCRRALRPDGLFIGVMLGGRTLGELRDVLMRAEIALRGGAAPRIAPMGDLRDLGALLQRAGLAMPVADAVPAHVSYATAFDLMRDLRAMGETNTLTDQDRRIPPRALFAETARLYAQDHAGADGRLRATFEVMFLSGWAPAADQPQPLRPGSAQMRLADALGTTEHDPRKPPKR